MEELYGIVQGLFPKTCTVAFVHLTVLSVLWNRNLN